MVFSDLFFLFVFLPAFILLYNLCAWIDRRRASDPLHPSMIWRNGSLVVFSLLFYAWDEPVYVLLMIVTVALNYLAALWMTGVHRQGWRKLALTTGIAVNLLILCSFKYLGFFARTLNSFGVGVEVPEIALPIGISFYIFQSVSYLVDVYRREAPAQRRYADLLLYISMFPQLIAGPIVRYDTIAREINDRHVNAEDLSDGVFRFLIGLGKKVILANQFSEIADRFLANGLDSLSTGGAWIGILAFTFQIYFDFSGYSDMAIGLGRMLGFKFRENFDYPYISRSITDFWRRWHISLSSFFRDYVYIPLGGNRYLHVRNVLVVWLLTGLWHGASLNFILWGLFYGFFLLVEKTMFGKRLLKIPPPLCYIYTIPIVVFGWAIFYFTDLNALWTFVKTAFGAAPLYDLTSVSALYSNLWLIALCVIASTPIPRLIFNHFCKTHEKIAVVIEPLTVAAGLALCFILLVGQTYHPFLYFRF